MSVSTGRFACTQCDRTFTEQRHLRAHVTKSHGNRVVGEISQTGVSTVLACVMAGCDREFASERVRADHLAAIHHVPLGRTFACRVCSQAFLTRAKRAAHEDVGHRPGKAAS